MPWRSSSGKSSELSRWAVLNPWTCYFCALLALILPLKWFVAAMIAAMVHEICHAVFIYLLGGRINVIIISPAGIVLEMQIFGTVRELVCAAAGPVGSILLLLFCHKVPEIALCAGIQGFFNLLPVYPMDGGRILRCLLVGCSSKVEKQIMRGTEFLVILGILFLTVLGATIFSAGSFAVMTGLFILCSIIIRKIPCKQR